MYKSSSLESLKFFSMLFLDEWSAVSNFEREWAMIYLDDDMEISNKENLSEPPSTPKKVSTLFFSIL